MSIRKTLARLTLGAIASFAHDTISAAVQKPDPVARR